MNEVTQWNTRPLLLLLFCFPSFLQLSITFLLFLNVAVAEEKETEWVSASVCMSSLEHYFFPFSSRHWLKTCSLQVESGVVSPSRSWVERFCVERFQIYRPLNKGLLCPNFLFTQEKIGWGWGAVLLLLLHTHSLTPFLKSEKNKRNGERKEKQQRFFLFCWLSWAQRKS